MNPFNSFPKEEIHIEKSGNEKVGPYIAIFAGSTIMVLNSEADIQEGDLILRNLPNGKVERSVVKEANFYQSMRGIQAHYQIKFQKWSANQMQKSPSHNITIHGAQSVQIGDFNTQNVINSIQALQNQIESSTYSITEKEEAKSLLAKFLEHPLVVSILGAATGGAIC